MATVVRELTALVVMLTMSGTVLGTWTEPSGSRERGVSGAVREA